MSPSSSSSSSSSLSLSSASPLTTQLSTRGSGGGGRILSEYELQRLQRIRRNEAKLKQLGLLSRTANKKKQQQRKQIREAASGKERRRNLSTVKTTAGVTRPRRKSQRLASAEPTASSTDKDDDDEEDEEKPRHAPKRRRRQTVQFNSSLSLPKPTAEMFPSNWTADMRHFLWKKCGNSWTSVQRVMDKLDVLAQGRGIRHPESHAHFYLNQQITPWQNVQALLDEGHEWVEKNGGDNGHGWLLIHPLRMLCLYQQWRQQLAATSSASS